MVNKYIMVNKLQFIVCAMRKSLGELREFLLNVGFILIYINGGKPSFSSFSSYFNKVVIQSIHNTFENCP